MRKLASRWLALAVFTVLCGAACGSQEKVCAADQRLCSSSCVSVQSDDQNCGACGNVCGAGRGCSAGTCVDCATTPGACTAEVLAACFNLSQVRPISADLSVSGAPLATDSGPSSIARAGDTFYVANDLSSSISKITLTPPASTTTTTTPPSIAISSASAGFSDLPFVASHAGALWVSNSATSTLVVVDASTGQVLKEVPLPANANPQGMDFAGAKAYVALNNLDAVAVLDVPSIAGASLRPTTIDLGALAPPGARAMPARVIVAGSKVYVSLSGLDPSTFSPPAGSHGRLAVIDATSDTATPLDLDPVCQDPGGMTLSGTTLWVACGFAPFSPGAPVSGGAIVPVDVSGPTAIPGAAIALTGHAAGSVAICNGRGYAGATESGSVLSFDPVQRTLLGTALVCPAASAGGSTFVSDVICAR